MSGALHLAALALLIATLAETAHRLPVAGSVGAMLGTSGRALRVMRSAGASDHWKERALLACARRTLAAVGRFLACLAALALIALPLGAAVEFAAPGFARFALGPVGLLSGIGIAFAYLALRRGPASAYGRLDRILHRLALAGPVAEISFALDRRLTNPDAEAAARGRHVFVTGLARAGTTILMRRIHASGQFRSLTYRDMPFVLAPNIWARLRGGAGRDLGVTERAHGDGLCVDADTPESLDEVFWRVFDGDSYIGAKRLHPHTPGPELTARFVAYVAAILAGSGTSRYLAKNNNNLLRLPALARSFPNAAIVVPFRAPLDHAASLLDQHRGFTDQQARDPFVRRYMGWLVHHEFGADHRPFATHARSAHTPDTLAYWLDQWCGVHDHLLSTAPDGTIFVSHAALCANPATWRALAARLGLKDDDPAAPAFVHRPRAVSASGLPPALVARADAIHARLLLRAEGASAENRVA